MSFLHNFLFNVYPYVCLTVFLMGSLARFDRDQYTWKSDSSQLLRQRQLRWGSNLFHIGILFLFFGHFVGLLTPHAIYEHFISPSSKQLVAVYSGGAAGLVCFVGLSLLLHRRIVDPRIRLTSHRTDLAILIILWLQLLLGLITLPYSLGHSDGSVMLVLSDWAQRIVTFRPDACGSGGPGSTVQAASDHGHDHLFVAAILPPGTCLEWFRHPGLCVAALPGGALAPTERGATVLKNTACRLTGATHHDDLFNTAQRQ